MLTEKLNEEKNLTLKSITSYFFFAEININNCDNKDHFVLQYNKW